MEYLSTPMYFCKLHAAWKKTTIFVKKKERGGERETILVHPCCCTSCMQHGKKEREMEMGKTFFSFYKMRYLFPSTYPKASKTQSVFVCKR
jgi:hypothetical protein